MTNELEEMFMDLPEIKSEIEVLIATANLLNHKILQLPSNLTIFQRKSQKEKIRFYFFPKLNQFSSALYINANGEDLTSTIKESAPLSYYNASDDVVSFKINVKDYKKTNEIIRYILQLF